MKALLLLLCALVLSSAAQPPTTKVVRIAADSVARAKFPGEMKQKHGADAIDAIAFVNGFVNAAIQPITDQQHYGTPDLWVMAPRDGMGDCEDYALTKMFMLRQVGMQVTGNMKLVTVVVHPKDAEPVGHAILAIRLRSGEVAYLDNEFPSLMTRRELQRAGYQFFDWKA